MTQQRDIIRENKELKSRLLLAEKWMQREVKSAFQHIEKEKQRKNTRKHFSNIFEEGNLAIVRQHVLSTFGENIEKKSPPYTLERLIDAEIHWKTLQTHPHMDGFMVVALYQKILDDWLEEVIVKKFRITLQQDKHRLSALDKMDEDLQKVVQKQYRLSLGRFYQVLQQIHTYPLIQKSTYTGLFAQEVKKYSFLMDSDFLEIFGKIINSGVFGEKRHTQKISYSEVKATRDFLVKIFGYIFH